MPSTIDVSGFAGPGTNSASFTPFSSLDLSAADMAVFVCSADGNASMTTDSDDWSKLGEQKVQTGNPVSGITIHATMAIFYKAGPGADETLVIDAAASSTFTGMLVEVAGAQTVLHAFAAGSSANPDPPSLDAGSEAPHLFIAAAATDGVINTSAGPSGYDDYDAEPAPALGPATAIATLESESQVENPGSFTADISRWIAATLALSE